MISLFRYAQPEKYFCKIESKRALAHLMTICLALPFWVVFCGALPASAFTAEDANTIVDSYNKVFYERTESGGHYKDTETTGVTYFWEQTEEIEGMLDAYERTRKPSYKNRISQLLQGFIETNGPDWSNNKFNDDSMWACITFSRAYLDTGTLLFRQTAQSNFDMVYARAWDDKLGGGLWWTTDNNTKNACVNGPASIAAYLLYLSTGDRGYLIKATDIYKWEKTYLFNSYNGQIYDAMNDAGVLATWSSTYNQGTFIGAANYLGDVRAATLATNYTMNKMGSAKSGTYNIMPAYGINGNNSGFNGICIRWIARFMKDNKLQHSYLAWLQANANAAWNMRCTADNLSWCEWENGKQTPADINFHSWDCSSSVVALQVVPPDQTKPLDQQPLASQAPTPWPSAYTNQAAPVSPAPVSQPPASTNQATPVSPAPTPWPSAYTNQTAPVAPAPTPWPSAYTNQAAPVSPAPTSQPPASTNQAPPVSPVPTPEPSPYTNIPALPDIDTK